MRFRACAFDERKTPLLFGDSLNAQQNARGEGKYGLVLRRSNERRPAAVTLQLRDEPRKIVGFDEEAQLLDHLDAPAVLADNLGLPDAAFLDQELLDHFAQIVGTV